MRVSPRVAANRRNAQRSTGPKSAEGKRRASQNALRHGLWRPAGEDEAGDLAGVIARDGVPMETALRLAAARIDLSRIRAHRLRVAQQLAGAEQGLEALVDELRRIDRYEGRALNRWRKALRE